MGDEDEVRAAVSNLIDNAVKYSGRDVHVNVETEKVEDRFVAVRVKDNGPGIPKIRIEAHLQALLPRLGAAGDARERHGPGTVYRALRRQAARRPRLGGERRARPRQHFCIAASYCEMSQSILIVEDEQHLAEGLRFNLEAEGYQVDAVETGEAALELLIPPAEDEPSPPSIVVVLDVMLPVRWFRPSCPKCGRGTVRADADADRARPSGRRP